MLDAIRMNEDLSDREKVLAWLKEFGSQVAEGGDTWGEDRSNAAEYFEDMPAELEAIRKHATQIHNNGQSFIHADLGGRTHFPADAGIADKTYTFSINPVNATPGGGVVHLAGNIFDDLSFGSAMDRIEKEAGRVHLFTFETVAGFLSQDPQSIMVATGVDVESVELIYLHVLLKRFERMSRVQRSGDLIYLGHNIFVNDYFVDRPEIFKTLLKKAGYTVVSEVNPKTIALDPRMLLQKI